ncbi:MAG: hypothetical protein WCI41_00265 [bacterium]
MGNEITLEEIRNKFDSLSEELKLAIMATNVDEKITEIGKERGLNIEQMGQLSYQTHLVMLGYVHADKFEESLKKSLGLSDELIKNIVADINTKILKQIREQLMSATEAPVSKEITLEEKITETPKTENEIPDLKAPVKESTTNIEPSELKELENKKIMESISAQKLKGAFQIPNIKTEYSLKNVSKEKEKTGTSVSQNGRIPLAGTIKPAGIESTNLSPSYSVKEDPYRMKPE